MMSLMIELLVGTGDGDGVEQRNYSNNLLMIIKLSAFQTILPALHIQVSDCTLVPCHSETH